MLLTAAERRQFNDGSSPRSSSPFNDARAAAVERIRRKRKWLKRYVEEPPECVSREDLLALFDAIDRHEEEEVAADALANQLRQVRERVGEKHGATSWDAECDDVLSWVEQRVDQQVSRGRFASRLGISAASEPSKHSSQDRLYSARTPSPGQAALHGTIVSGKPRQSPGLSPRSAASTQPSRRTSLGAPISGVGVPLRSSSPGLRSTADPTDSWFKSNKNNRGPVQDRANSGERGVLEEQGGVGVGLEKRIQGLQRVWSELTADGHVLRRDELLAWGRLGISGFPRSSEAIEQMMGQMKADVKGNVLKAEFVR